GDGKEVKKLSTGGRPYDVVQARNGLLYVSDWAGRQVFAVDPGQLRTIARIGVGEHPNQLTLHPKDDRLFVACASNNCVSVIDVAERDKSEVKGFIPTGWYPTALAVTPDGRQLLVGVGKGNQTRANPIYKEGEKSKGERRQFPYIGSTLSGALSVVA